MRLTSINEPNLSTNFLSSAMSKLRSALRDSRFFIFLTLVTVVKPVIDASGRSSLQFHPVVDTRCRRILRDRSRISDVEPNSSSESQMEEERAGAKIGSGAKAGASQCYRLQLPAVPSVDALRRHFVHLHPPHLCALVFLPPRPAQHLFLSLSLCFFDFATR